MWCGSDTYELDTHGLARGYLQRVEDGDGIIVRLIETEGKNVTATLTIPHLTIKQAYRTNLVEENEEKATSTEHTITAPIKAFGITTIRIQT